MRYEQSKPLVEELMNISVLFHLSPSLLRQKIYESIDKHIPDLDPACMERGCPCIETFPPKATHDKN
jgi:hypothetical protein